LKFREDITSIVLHSQSTWEGQSVSGVFLAKFTYTLHILLDKKGREGCEMFQLSR